MQHDHLKFYSSSSSSSSSTSYNNISIGGADVVPTLNIVYDAHSIQSQREKTAREKQMEIVEYLKLIAPRDLKASFVGILFLIHPSMHFASISHCHRYPTRAPNKLGGRYSSIGNAQEQSIY